MQERLRENPCYQEAVENAFIQGAITKQQRDELLSNVHQK